jgi:hypothetical protein
MRRLVQSFTLLSLLLLLLAAAFGGASTGGGSAAVATPVAGCTIRWHRVPTTDLVRGSGERDDVVTSGATLTPAGDLLVVGMKQAGARHAPLVARMTGGRWFLEAVSIRSQAGLTAVDASSPSATIAVGSTLKVYEDGSYGSVRGVAFLRRAGRWQPMNIPSTVGALTDVAVTASGTAWAVGKTRAGDAPVLLSWDTHVWRIVPLDPAWRLQALSGVSTAGADVWVAGDSRTGPVILRHTGDVWAVSRPAVPRLGYSVPSEFLPDPTPLGAKIAASPGAVVATDSIEWADVDTHVFVETGDGSRWRMDVLPTDKIKVPGITIADAATNGRLTVAVGTGGEFFLPTSWYRIPFAAVLRGDRWTLANVGYGVKLSENLDAGLTGVALAHDGAAWAVGTESKTILDRSTKKPATGPPRPLLLTGRCS